MYVGLTLNGIIFLFFLIFLNIFFMESFSQNQCIKILSDRYTRYFSQTVIPMKTVREHSHSFRKR